MFTKKYKDYSGITLIALVITVIILLILASVAISLITGQNGLFAMANQAGDEYNKSAMAESGRFADLNAILDQYDIINSSDSTSSETASTDTYSVQVNATNVTLSILPAYVGPAGTTYKYKIGNGDWVSPRISTDTSHTFIDLTPETQYTVNVKIGDVEQTSKTITTNTQMNMKDVTTLSDAILHSASPILATDTTYNGTYKELTDSNNATVKVPVGFTVRYDSALTVDGGVVVADEYDNQWVWIPVNENNTYTVRKYGTPFELAEEYTTTTINDKSYYYEPVPTSGDIDYNVATIGGYYFARYESGSLEDTQAKTMRTESTTGKTVTLRRDQVPYNYIAINVTEANKIDSTHGNAINLSSNFARDNNYKTGINTKICSSYAWDTAISFIGNDVWANGNDDSYLNIKQNYKDAVEFRYLKIDTGEIVEAVKPTIEGYEGEAVLTGQGDSTKNIYDMGGNCYEFTSGNFSASFYPYITRGGAGNQIFSTRYAGSRGYAYGKPFMYRNFRVTLYLS